MRAVDVLAIVDAAPARLVFPSMPVAGTKVKVWLNGNLLIPQRHYVPNGAGIALNFQPEIGATLYAIFWTN